MARIVLALTLVVITAEAFLTSSDDKYLSVGELLFKSNIVFLVIYLVQIASYITDGLAHSYIPVLMNVDLLERARLSRGPNLDFAYVCSTTTSYLFIQIITDLVVGALTSM